MTVGLRRHKRCLTSHTLRAWRTRAQNSGTVFVPHGGWHAVMYSVVDSAKKARSSLAHFTLLNQDDGLLGNVNKGTAKSDGSYSPSISTIASYCEQGSKMQCFNGYAQGSSYECVVR